jgi:hypothetical protein
MYRVFTSRSIPWDAQTAIDGLIFTHIEDPQHNPRQQLLFDLTWDLSMVPTGSSRGYVYTASSMPSLIDLQFPEDFIHVSLTSPHEPWTLSTTNSCDGGACSIALRDAMVVTLPKHVGHWVSVCSGGMICSLQKRHLQTGDTIGLLSCIGLSRAIKFIPQGRL